MSLEAQTRALLAPVSRLDELPALERRFVRWLRYWYAGRAGQAVLPGPAVLARFDALLCLVLAHGRRPIRIAAVGSGGVTGDECVLARFVALAAEGAREDAVLIATLLVRADLALGLGQGAEALGLALRRGPEPPAALRGL